MLSVGVDDITLLIHHDVFLGFFHQGYNDSVAHTGELGNIPCIAAATLPGFGTPGAIADTDNAIVGNFPVTDVVGSLVGVVMIFDGCLDGYVPTIISDQVIHISLCGTPTKGVNPVIMKPAMTQVNRCFKLAMLYLCISDFNEAGNKL